jgi:hypothetical protein
MRKFIILTLVLVVILVGCSSDSKTSMIYIKCDDGITLDDKIDLNLFGGFKPGIKFGEAKDQYGEPIRIWTGTNRTIYHLYPSKKANIAVAKETQSSGGMPTLEWWTIYAYPTNQASFFNPEIILSSDITEKLNQKKLPCKVVIHGSKKENMIFCTVMSNGISDIRWFNASSRR